MLPLSSTTSNPQTSSVSTMTTNDDILRVLNDMKAQANANNEALRKDVNEKMTTLTEKIDTVKKDAIEKETRDDAKMSGILSRLDSIEKKMYENKNKCEENKIERQKQADRTSAFKEAVGLVDKPDNTNRTKTWSELVDASRKEEEEKKDKEKLKKEKHWSKKIYARERRSKEDEDKGEKTKESIDKEDDIRKKINDEKEKDELRINEKTTPRRRRTGVGTTVILSGMEPLSAQRRKRNVKSIGTGIRKLFSVENFKKSKNT